MMTWRKQPRRGFVGVTWVGSAGGRDMFGISMQVSQHRQRRTVGYRLYRIGSGTVAPDFAKLAEARSHAEKLALVS